MTSIVSIPHIEVLVTTVVLLMLFDKSTSYHSSISDAIFVIRKDVIMSLDNTNNTNTTKDVALFGENSILPLPECLESSGW